MADSKCCQGMDPSCEGPSSCADRAWAEIERLRDELEEQRYWNNVLKEQVRYTI